MNSESVLYLSLRLLSPLLHGKFYVLQSFGRGAPLCHTGPCWFLVCCLSCNNRDQLFLRYVTERAPAFLSETTRRKAVDRSTLTHEAPNSIRRSGGHLHRFWLVEFNNR